jgi:hypothetical protein
MSIWVQLLLVATCLYLLRKPLWRIVWKSVRYLLWRPKLLMLSIIGFLCVSTYGIWNAPDAPEVVPPPPAAAPPAPPGLPAPKELQASPQAARKNDQAQKPRGPRVPVSYPTTLPEIPSKVKDGNSRFAANLLQRMSPMELQWYSRVFYHALQTLPSGETHQWLYEAGENRMFGRITPGGVDKQDSGITCRPFQELLVVDGKAQRMNGVACQRLEGGWCKLRPGSARTCEIQPPSGLDGFWYSAKRSLKQLF